MIRLQVNLEDMFPNHVFSDTDGVSRYLPNIMDCCDPPDGLSVIPPAPGAVASSHPLLSRNNDAAGSSSGTQGQGASRSRGYGIMDGVYPFGVIACNLGHAPMYSGELISVLFNRRTLGVQSRMGAASGSRTTMSAAWQLLSGRANPPAILQRLFGPAQDHHAHMPIEFRTTTSSNSHQGHHVTTTPRVLFANTMLDAPEDWFVDLYDENVPGCPSQRNTAGGSGTVPTAHSRWIEESRVLDGDSLHDCVALLKPEIIPHLEKLRDEELAQRKETIKRKAAKDKKDTNSGTSASDSTKVEDRDEEEHRLQQQPLSATASPAGETAATSSSNSDTTAMAIDSSRDMTTVIEPTQVHEEFAQNIVEGLLRPGGGITATASNPNDRHDQTSPRPAAATSGKFSDSWVLETCPTDEWTERVDTRNIYSGIR